jgi:hypothetical protein
MLFLKKMINVTLGPNGTRDAIAAKLYDSSCHICNTTKSDGVYIKARWVEEGAAAAAAGKRLEFSPHNEKIMVDILTFILATRIGQTVEVKRYREPSVPGGNATERLRAQTAARDAALQAAIQEDQGKKPICSNRDAVVSYVAKGSGGERVISRSTFTSITTVAERVNEGTLGRITDTLPADIPEPIRTAAARSAEAAVAFTIAPRFNNLTRAVIEQITPPEIAAATAIPSPRETHIHMDTFNYLTTELDGRTDMVEKGTFYRVFDVPDPIPSALPGVAAVPVVADLSPAPASGPAAVAAPPRMSSEAKEHLNALDTAGVPKSVDREKAWAWIRTRYMAIWTRMNDLCVILNREHEQIEASVRSLAEQPLLTPGDIDELNAWSKVSVPAGAAAAESVGSKRRRAGVRFTIRRRSESRQTKKNRMRKPRVIEVNI